MHKYKHGIHDTRSYGLYCSNILNKMSVFFNSLHFSVNCTAGHYRNQDMSSCAKCDINTISTAGASSCTDCPAGAVANEDRTECGELIAEISSSSTP